MREETTRTTGTDGTEPAPQRASSVASGTSPVVDPSVVTEEAVEATPELLVGVPDGGGLRQAFTGLTALRVPAPRSVFVSAGSLVLLLVSLTVFVVAVDAVLGAMLAGERLRLAPVAGIVGLLAALGSLALLLGTALDGPTQPRLLLERHPRRVAAGAVLLVVTAVCALLWMSGIGAA